MCTKFKYKSSIQIVYFCQIVEKLISLGVYHLIMSDFSVVKIRRGPNGSRCLTIPKKILEQIGDSKYASADIDEHGNMIFKPITI